MEVTTCKTTKNEVKEFYNKLIQKEIDALTKEKSNGTRKYNVLIILSNRESVFTGLLLHYKDVAKKTIFQRSIAEIIKLRKEWFDEIKEKNRT